MTETEAHKEMKRRLGQEYQRLGFQVEFEKTINGQRWDLVASSPEETFFVECETFPQTKTSEKPMHTPEKGKAILFVPEWVGKFDGLLIDGPHSMTLNPISSNYKATDRILTSGWNTELLKREIDLSHSSAAETTSYRLPHAVRSQFKAICAALGLDQSPVLEWLIKAFIRAFVGQAKLDLFTNQELPATNIVQVYQPLNLNMIVFEKAEILLAKTDLREKLDNLQAAASPEVQKEFQLTLAEALKKVKRVYTASRDPELTKLVLEAEAVLT